MNWLEILFVILAVIGYGIVTMIQMSQINKQRSQIDDLKSINGIMATYANVFDAKKVEEYVSMTDKLQKMKSAKLIADSDSLKKVSHEAINEQTKYLEEFYFKTKGEEYHELYTMVGNIIYQNKDNKENLNMILEKLPKTRHLFSDITDFKNKV